MLDRGTPQARPRSTAGAGSQADNPVFDGIISLLPVLNEVFDYDLDPARDGAVGDVDLCNKFFLSTTAQTGSRTGAFLSIQLVLTFPPPLTYCLIYSQEC